MARRSSARSALGHFARPAINDLTMRKVSPSKVRPHGLAVLLGSEDRLAVTVAKAHRCLGIREIKSKRNAVERGAAGEAEQGQRQEKSAHD